MKIAVLFFALLTIAAIGATAEQTEPIKLVTVGTANPIPAYKKKGKFKGYKRGR